MTLISRYEEESPSEEDFSILEDDGSSEANVEDMNANDDDDADDDDEDEEMVARNL